MTPEDLDKLGKSIAGFAKMRFSVVAGGHDGDGYDAIDAMDNDDDWLSFAEVFADDCAVPVMEILAAAPDLLRLARVGAAYIELRNAHESDSVIKAERDALDESLAAYRAAKEHS